MSCIPRWQGEGRRELTGGGQVSLAVNERRLAEVGAKKAGENVSEVEIASVAFSNSRYSNALEDARGSEEGLDAVVAEVVGLSYSGESVSL